MIQISKIDAENLIIDDDYSLESLTKLFNHLNGKSIRYCHWKSNIRLMEALKGETDLDLLVDRKNSNLFRQILLEHGIKPAIATPGWRYPSIEDHLGFDVSSGKLFHLHVHYQLILGEQFVKNYHLPIENQVLDSAIMLSGVKVPAPEIELIILCIRALLKYRDRDVIKDIFSIRSPGIPAHIRIELENLCNQISIESVDKALSFDLDILPGETILEFIKALKVDPRDGRRYFVLRKNIRNSLRNFQRYSRAKATSIYFKELWHRRNSFQPSKSQGKMAFTSGGLALALIGIDGAGKTTLHQQLIAWLSWKMDVQGFYLGSKKPSKISDFLYLVFRMSRRSHRSLSKRFGKQSRVSQLFDNLKRNLLFAHYLAIGNDRYKRYKIGSALAKNGSIVIYDRFPLEKISSQSEFRLMDGPQSLISGELSRGFLSRLLVSKELDYYQKMQLPDYLFVLDVNPQVSIQRKPDHNEVVLTAKNRAVNNLLENKDVSRHGQQVIHINANLPFQEVFRQLKSDLWEIL